MGKLDKLVTEAPTQKPQDQSQELQQEQPQSAAAIPPAESDNQVHDDVPASEATTTANEPTEAQTHTAEPPHETAPRPSWWKRLRQCVASGGRVRQLAKASEAAEGGTVIEASTGLSTGDGHRPPREQAAVDLATIREEIKAYEAAVTDNARIIKDINNIYDADKDYVTAILNLMNKDIDHRKADTMNELASNNLDLLAQNLYSLPPVMRLAEKDIRKAEEAARAQAIAEVDAEAKASEKAPQEAKKEAEPTPIPTPKPKTKPQTASPVSGNGLMPILKDVALAILFFAVVALGASYFTSDGQAYSPDAQSTIDSLQAVIDSQSKELSEKRKGNKDYNLLRWKYDRMAKIKAREEAKAIFDYSDYNRLILEYDRLRKEYANLELKTIDYAKAYKELKATMGTSGRAKEGREEPQEPSRGKSVFNSIESHEDRSPHSPQSY